MIRHLFTCLIFACGTQTIAKEAYHESLTPIESRKHIGQKRTVCGYVNEVKKKKYGNFINMGLTYTTIGRQQVLVPEFTVLLWANDKKRLGIDPVKSFAHKQLCFTGIIQAYKSFRFKPHKVIPQITLKDMRQVRPQYESR